MTKNQKNEVVSGKEKIEPVYVKALKLAVETATVSISAIQRKCAIGYNKAGAAIDWMVENGYVSEYDGARGRTVLITRAEFDKKFGDGELEESVVEEAVEPEYIDALRLAVESGSVSISAIQRKCSIGYNKAGKMIDWMENEGYVSAFDGSTVRKVLLTKEEFDKKFGE